MSQDFASGFLLCHIQGPPGAVTKLYAINYKRRSDVNMVDGYGTDGTH